MSSNDLTGSIPLGFYNLSSVEIFALDFNRLHGNIPVATLPKLRRLYLNSNNFSGALPASLSNSSLIERIQVTDNSFTGNMIHLTRFSALQYLSVGYNRLNGDIDSIGNLSNHLSFLSLRDNLNVLTGTIPSEVGALRNLGIMDFSNNRLSGTIPTSLGCCVTLSRLYLMRNSLQGEIPDGLNALKGLQYLDISQNNLSGMIPRFLVEFRLLYLNISFNELQGEVPTLGVFQNESAISLEGNQGLCGESQGPDFLRLSYADLISATEGFSETNLLGIGRFGFVYKGTINADDGRTDLAVKVLDPSVRDACKSLASECNALRGIRHRNLLKIVSVCDSTDFQGNDFKALVYEFMANGNLDNWLHPENEGRGALSAIQRLNIAIDIACAVEYLHCGTDSIVIHGDLKPSNILLDKDMVTKVGDFGLAKIVSSISQNLTSMEGSSSLAIKGTIGYIAPEYGMSYVASTQGDVYSYGVLVLEMFTNKRPTSDAFEGCLNLQGFVSTALTDHVMEVVDPFLHQELHVDEKYWDCIVSILRIGVRCSKELPRDRMSMADVVNDLKKIRNAFPVY
ncbi:receptor kinase-like protein Xa21 [Salvia hispanica]|uniref:receptor kinase-like protein Xa21 n=1 Tax=Salvia hispanica TaxID=49212 RepID=UPI0020099AC9|nr:receptor kinase-like protein Xa21 [Salvia hispanica]